MRRFVTASRVIVPAVVLGLMLAGCGSGSGGKRTVTLVETVSSSGGGAASTGGGASSTGGGVTVAPPGGSGSASSETAGSGTAESTGTGGGAGASTGDSGSTATGTANTKSSAKKSTKKPTTKKNASLKNIKDPLAVDCPNLLSPSDVKKIAGATIPAKSKRVKYDANNKVNSTGSVRCLYGMKGKNHDLSLRITQYKSANAAAEQIGVTVQSETGLGAKASKSTVGGQPADVLLRDGGLIDVQYGDWTLAIATRKGLLHGDVAGQLTKLADRALARVLKNAG